MPNLNTPNSIGKWNGMEMNDFKSNTITQYFENVSKNCTKSIIFKQNRSEALLCLPKQTIQHRVLYLPFYILSFFSFITYSMQSLLCVSICGSKYWFINFSLEKMILLEVVYQNHMEWVWRYLQHNEYCYNSSHQSRKFKIVNRKCMDEKLWICFQWIDSGSSKNINVLLIF